MAEPKMTSVEATTRFNGHEPGEVFETSAANAEKWQGMGLCKSTKRTVGKPQAEPKK